MVLHHFFGDIPIITWAYLVGAFLTTAACYTNFVSPYSIYYSWPLVVQKGQWWRVFSNFFFFDNQFGLDFLFRMFVLQRYCRMLEENSFRGRTADFLVMLLFGGSIMVLVAPLLNIQFLGSSLMLMLVYVWSRRNRFVRLNFYGLFPIDAPYLPWVFLGLSLLLDRQKAFVVDLLGVGVGHLYYYLEDVYPLMVPSRTKLIRTPHFLKRWFGDDAPHRVAI